MFHDVYQAVCSKRRSRARPSHRHPPEGEGAGAGGRKQEVNEWASANRGLMGVWIDGSGDGCVGGFSANWRCKCAAAVHIVSEKRRDPPVAAEKSNLAWWILLVGMTCFNGIRPNAGSKDEGMHAWSVCTFSRGFTACGGGGFWLAARACRLRRCNSQGEILRLAVQGRTNCAGTLVERIKVGLLQ